MTYDAPVDYRFKAEVEKVAYAHVCGILSDPDLIRVASRFGSEPFRRSSVVAGFAHAISEVGASGKLAVEIGTWAGLTACILSRSFERVVSIDIADHRDKHEIRQTFGANNIEFITVNDNREKAMIIRELVFDFAYVDGDHAHDTETDFELVKHCGDVLFHEFWPAQPPVFSLGKRMGFRPVGHNFGYWRKR